MTTASVQSTWPFPIFSDGADGHPLALRGSGCGHCGKITFPPAPICSGCRGADIHPVELSDTGKLYSFSVLHTAARGWQAPYILGYVDLPEEVRLFTHIDVPEAELSLDMPMRLHLRAAQDDQGTGAPLPFVFRPVAERADDHA